MSANPSATRNYLPYGYPPFRVFRRMHYTFISFSEKSNETELETDPKWRFFLKRESETVTIEKGNASSHHGKPIFMTE